jgi:hypothetical protein
VTGAAGTPVSATLVIAGKAKQSPTVSGKIDQSRFFIVLHLLPEKLTLPAAN